MNVKAVSNRIDRIRQLVRDRSETVAVQMKHDLFEGVLYEIAHGAKDARVMAREALRANDVFNQGDEK